MDVKLTRRWWVLGLRGLIVALFGVLVLARPLASAVALVLTFGTVALIEGVVGLIGAVTGRVEGDRGFYAIAGILSIIAGVLTFIYPGMSAVAIYSLIAVWAVIRGALTMYATSRGPDIAGFGPIMYLAGVASILFGVLMVARPVVGFAALMSLIGVSAIVIGVLEIVGAFRVRSLGERVSVTMSRAGEAAKERMTTAGPSDRTER
jgi:uncharacterized membrane protein HdeD (DUF308 family)